MQATLHSTAPLDNAGIYEAPMDAGPLRLALQATAGERPSCAADAALRLVQAEPLLAALEAWLAQAQPPAPPPEWAWRDAPAAPAAALAGAAQARWVGADLDARLALPWALLRRLPPPELALQWLPAPAEWVLATLALTPSEREALEPGGALLLPDSFAPGWPAELRATDEVAPAAGADAAPGGERWEVRSALPDPIEPQRLLGWDGALPPLDDAAPLTLWRQVGGQLAEPWARGRCLPWGQGRAMLIEQVSVADRSADRSAD